MCKSRRGSPRRADPPAVHGGSNTTMNHLLLRRGRESRAHGAVHPHLLPLGRPARRRSRACPRIPRHRCCLAPNIGSYVGGDITAGAFASLIWDKDEFSLFIDLGTNGELVFGNRDFLMSCACSAGPAFEGGDISCGMRATDGAVEAVQIDRDTMEPTLRHRRRGGSEARGHLRLRHHRRDRRAVPHRHHLRQGSVCPARAAASSCDHHGMGRYVLAFPEESETRPRNFHHRAWISTPSSAPRARSSPPSTSCSPLLDMDVSVLEHVYVAGGIGSGINMENAVRIGMFPDIDRSLFELYRQLLARGRLRHGAERYRRREGAMSWPRT